MGFNGGFEDAVRDEAGRTVPALWRIRRTSNAGFARDTQFARTGRASGRIDGVVTGTGPDAAFAIAPPDPAVQQGDRSTVTGFAQATSKCGEVRFSHPLVHGRGARRRRRSVRAGRMRHARLAAAACDRSRPLRCRLRRPLSTRRGHCWTRVVRRRLVRMRTRKRTRNAQSTVAGWGLKPRDEGRGFALADTSGSRFPVSGYGADATTSATIELRTSFTPASLRPSAALLDPRFSASASSSCPSIRSFAAVAGRRHPALVIAVTNS